MAKRKIPGLQKRGNTWHIDKKVYGKRLCESCGTDNLEEAEKYLARRIEALRQLQLYGVRPEYLFREAAIRYIKEHQEKKSLELDVYMLKKLDRYIGDVPLTHIHMGKLQAFVMDRRNEGVKNRTINAAIQSVRRILNLAASEWFDDQGKTWLEYAPKIKLLNEYDARKPYPLTWDEQQRLFNELPPHLQQMALFAVNTGCRNREICGLRWEWEVTFPELATSIFVIPGNNIKNGDDRVVILNKQAERIIEAQRGKHLTHVFHYQGKPINTMLTSAWKRARKKASLEQVRVHDLKHTFGRRLRAAGVSLEDRQDLLGHRSGRITTHYCAAEMSNLIEAANKVCEQGQSMPTLTLVRTAA